MRGLGVRGTAVAQAAGASAVRGQGVRGTAVAQAAGATAVRGQGTWGTAACGCGCGCGCGHGATAPVGLAVHYQTLTEAPGGASGPPCTSGQRQGAAKALLPLLLREDGRPRLHL